MSNDTRIGLLIATARRVANRSQMDVARAAGISQTRISRIELCKHTPTKYELEVLGRALGVNFADTTAHRALSALENVGRGR